MLSPDNNYLFIATTTITKAIGTAGVTSYTTLVVMVGIKISVMYGDMVSLAWYHVFHNFADYNPKKIV